ncbi:7911_t:CDS:2 [Acaulospora morrowiae]|uniref:Biogenesis of lysosome-related organelles complex 1 subunit 7 n=1 Tax=Acaulospora morrowiae TaxID=94023 RepID=A0A9N8VJZ9_9GLOM|nr:7911_t:CDS:2 [Acaulospora morrowiae]
MEDKSTFADVDLSASANFENNVSFSDVDANTSGTTTPTHNEDKAMPTTENSKLSSEKEKFAKGLSILLKPVIEEMDSRIVAVKNSQEELNKEIERLLAELQLFVEAAKSPPIQPSIQKLMVARRKLANTNQTLKIVHDRIDRMHAQLGKGNIVPDHT